MNIRHWLLPSKKNNYHPIALRPAGLSVFLGLLIVLQLAYNVFTAHQMQVLGYAIDINANDISAISNQQRSNAGIPVLIMNSQLSSAALAKANDMFAKNYWAHVAPDGKTPWAFITDAGYAYQTVGENLAKDFNTSSGVVNGWLNSFEHRANLLNANYQDVGYAVVNGNLLGSETTLVVAMYGVKATAPTAVATTSTTPVAAPTAQSPAVPDPVVTTPVTTELTQSEQPVAVTKIAATTSHSATTTATQPLVKGEVKSTGAALPVKLYKSLQWAQKASIVLVSTLLLLFIMKHTLVWRQHKRGYTHIWLRAHPLGQAAILSAVLVVTILSGFGTVL